MARSVRISVLSILLFSLGLSASAKQLAVVVDKSNTLGAITAPELAKVFRFDNRKWPDGRNVVLVVLDPSTPDMRMIAEKVYHLPVDDLKTLLAAHRSSVVVVNTEEQLLKSVESIPGAVGVVDVYSITSRVNVLKVDGKLPLEQGYFLRGTQ
jgi:ABC-type phosphate transport system substrate-binding protein